jgi:hypothetical protein
VATLTEQDDFVVWVEIIFAIRRSVNASVAFGAKEATCSDYWCQKH